jgi:hypothetical protein
LIECEVLGGLRPAAADEVRRVLGRQARPLGDDDPTALRFAYAGPLPALLRLRTVVAAYLLVTVPGRRPSTLLGDSTLFDQVETVRALHPPGAFSSFRLSAPGRQSAALRRLRSWPAAPAWPTTPSTGSCCCGSAAPAGAPAGTC